MKKLFCLLPIVMSLGCLSAQAETDVSVTQEFGTATQIPNVPAAYGTISVVKPLDVSDKMKKFSDQSMGLSYHVVVDSDQLSAVGSNFSSVDNVVLKMANLVLINHNVTPSEKMGNAIDMLTLPVSSDTVKVLLEKGPVDMGLELTGQIGPGFPTKFSNVMNLHLDVSFEK